MSRYARPPGSVAFPPGKCLPRHVEPLLEVLTRRIDVDIDFDRASCIIELIQQHEVRESGSQGGLCVQIHISATDGVPIYLQIVNQVKYLVAAGRLEAGEEMPPIRVLAERLVVNPNTVARAYRELEAAGVVEKRRTAGTYVSAAGSPLARRERVKILTDRVDAVLVEARQLGIGVDELLELIGRRDQAMKPRVGDEKS
jgi:GntR family transcriptional regulator